MSVKPEKEYFEYLATGRFMLQRSSSSGKYVFYPRMAVPGTGETDLEWVPASGLGVVYSVTVIRQKPLTPDYNVALIDLAEGVRMMARVDGIAATQVRIGQAVKAKVISPAEGSTDVAMVVFEPV